jgi:hypothetical protein
MVAVPEATPPTIPVPDPTVATDVLLLIQVPPDETSLNDIFDPTHTAVGPVMADGIGFTVTMAVVLQPAREYE